jgi:Tfp pilus assembly protein FimV
MTTGTYRTAAPISRRPTRPTPRGRASTRLSRPSRASTRLTVRGRVLVVSIVMLTVLALWAWWGNSTAASDVPHHATSHSVVVEPGQTLWDIAGRIAPDHDARQVVADIEDLNGLSDPGSLPAGQSLYVPSYR